MLSRFTTRTRLKSVPKHAYQSPAAAVLRRRALAATVVAMMVAALSSGAMSGSVDAGAAPSSGSVAGSVFEDYNANGSDDAGSAAAATASATDVGVGNASVTVTDSTGATVGTATTDTGGLFTVSVAGAATTEVRVEVTPPTGYTAGPHGADSASTVQFVTLGSAAASAVDVALVRQGDYSQATPPLLNVEQVGAIGAGGVGGLLTQNQPSLVRSAYADRGVTTTTTEATAAQTGSIWGAASLHQDYAFTTAFLRRHAVLGSGGLGAVYLTSLTSGTPNATLWATIPDAGTDPRVNQGAYTFTDWFHDTTAFPQVGKVGLGGATMAPDNSALYVVNLNNKSLYKVPVSLDGAGKPVAGTPVNVGMPTALPGAATGCATDQVRPFGVAAQNGAVWVTLTCTGPTAADLRGYVYRYDTTSGSFGAAPAFEMALSGYGRGRAFNNPCCSATWNVWPATDTTFPITATGTNISSAHPEPLLSDVNFDSNGDMTIGIKDRFGDQIGYEDGNLTAGNNSTYQGFAAGDILRACLNPAGTAWVLESNAVCGTRTGANPGNNQGPGGGEFYSDEFGNSHQQTALGGLLQLPGYAQIIDTAFDPGTVFRTEGVQFSSNADGAASDYHQLESIVNADGTGNQGSFSKAGGLGDITALVDAAPIEIGNRVWIDTNEDGVQDAGEPSVAGVTVHLYAADGTTLLATAVTDADGNYYFSNATGTDTASAKYAVTGLTATTKYVVKLDNAADFASGGPLYQFAPTLTGSGTDTAVDSNGTTVSGVDQAPVTTGVDGTNDHTIDFGFTPPVYAVGDYVWFDTNRNGIQDPSEKGVAGVTVTLLDSAGKPAVAQDGTPVAPVQTDAAGHYVFDNLPAGSYTAQFSTLPTGYGPTTQSAAGSTSADDSNPDPTTLLTPAFPVGPVGTADVRAVVPGDGTTKAVAINPTIDMGIVAAPSVSVGDFVWLDTNRDGIQDAGEPGIPGVTVTLTGPTGLPVTDVFGNTVGPATTDSKGNYEFANLPVLPAGQHYTTHVDNTQAALAAFSPTKTGQGTSATDSSTGSATSTELTHDGDSDQTLDFGFIAPAVSVGDFVWADSNGNGVQDKGEPGIAGVIVTLTGPDGKPVTGVNGEPVGAQVTDSNGKYEFTNLPVLPAGQHYTTHIDNAQTALAGYTPTKTGAGTTATDSSNGSATSTDLTADGDSDQTLDFGFVKPVSVGDFVWKDTNRDGIQNPGEPGIPGVTVTITNAAGGPVLDVDGTPATTTVTTDANGKYEFSGLAPGTYTVTVTPPAGLVPTVPNAGSDPAKDSSTGHATSATLPSGASDPTLDFGFVTPAVSVGDFVWVDSNGNGVQDKGEPGIAGVTVTLTGPTGKPVTDVNGHPVSAIKTTSDGKYEFANLPVLPAGQHYTTHIDNTQPALAGYAPTRTGAGTRATDSSTGSATSTDLTTNGASDQTLDFGFVKPVSVGNFVWVDKNGNGVQDKGEPGIPGVIVTITDSNGRPVHDLGGHLVGPVTTNGKGGYSFTDLPPGTYVTHIDNSQSALAPYEPTRSGTGHDRGLDSSDGSATSAALTSGQSDLTLDFGFVVPGAAFAPTLPFTGSPIDALLVYGLLLLLGGLLVLGIARRRRLG